MRFFSLGNVLLWSLGYSMGVSIIAGFLWRLSGMGPSSLSVASSLGAFSGSTMLT